MTSENKRRVVTPLTLTRGNNPFQLSSVEEARAAEEESGPESKKEIGETVPLAPVSPLAVPEAPSIPTPGSQTPKTEETSESSSVFSVPSLPSVNSSELLQAPSMESGQDETKQTEKGSDKE